MLMPVTYGLPPTIAEILSISSMHTVARSM
jgi:hypothetical protein